MRGPVAKWMLIAAAVLISGTAFGITPPADILDAYVICDKSDLRPIEGIWTYPADDVTVLVYRNVAQKGVYDIFVVESADCSLPNGSRLGKLTASADPEKYELTMFTSIKNGVLSAPRNATATFSEKKEALTMKKSGVKFRINPTRLLPYFWRLISISVGSKEPAPEGLVKLYPSYDGNGSTKRGPRYL